MEDIWCGLKDKYYEKMWKYDKKSYRKEIKFYKIMRCHKNKYMTRSHMKKFTQWLDDIWISMYQFMIMIQINEILITPDGSLL